VSVRQCNDEEVAARLPGHQMHDAEKHVVRPYLLVKDIAAAVDSGAEIAVPPMEVAARHMRIIFQHGIESGLWQLRLVRKQKVT
jgi:hypothetical protein